jgi:hypothetical protein
MTDQPTPSSVLRPDAAVPARLSDLLTEAALLAAHDAGAADAHHGISGDLDALLREMRDRGAPGWVCQRIDELAQQHLDAGDDYGHAADHRLDVLEWLQHRSPVPVASAQGSIASAGQARPAPTTMPSAARLRLVTDPLH